MRKFLTATTATLALAGVTLGAAAPAEARYHGGYRGHYHGGHSGAVLGAGILGLAAGAAIASDSYRGGGYYGGRGYYGGYGYGPAYYAPPPPPYGYYGGPPCRTDWRWDGWGHRYVPVNYCG